MIITKNNLFVEYLNQEVKNLEYIQLQNNTFLNISQKQKAKKSDLIIVCTYNAAVNKYQAELAEKLAANNMVAVLAVRNPYDYQLLEETQAFITTYDYSPANQKAASDFILGKFSPAGQLPVNIN